MSILKIGMYASQFPVGDKDPYWNDVLALIRCDGELVDLKGNCTLVADVGYKRFTEGENHLAAYANLVNGNYSRFLINSGFDPNADWTLEYTLTPHEKTVAQTSLYPSFIGISSLSQRIISVYGAATLDYTQSIAVYTPASRGISSRSLVKNKPLKVAIQQISGYGIVHFDGILVNNTELLASIIESPDDYYLNIFSLTSDGTTGLGTIEEIRLTQAARYGLDNYVIDSPVFVQDKLPVPIYPKDPLYSDVVSLLRVQQGYLYDAKLNALTPTTTSSTVAGYYLDALKFTDASHKRVVSLVEPLVGDFTFEFTFSLDAINESLLFEYLLRLMDGSSPSQPVIEVWRNEDEPNKLVLTGFVSESIEVVAGFNRFAMTKTGTSLKCYLNGELKTTTTLPSLNPISEIHLSSDTNSFSGTLEELRLTKGVRYAGNYTPSEEVFPTRTGDDFDPHWDKVVSLLHFDGNLNDETGATWGSLPSGWNFGASTFDGQRLNRPSGTSGSIASDINADFAEGEDFTIEFQYTVPSTPNRYDWVLSTQRLSGTIKGWRITYDGSNQRVEFNDYGGPRVSVQVAAGFTKPFCIERHNGTIRMYLDGVVVATQEFNGAIVGTENLTIGDAANHANTRGGFSIDELRVTRGAARYQGDYTPSAVPFPNR